MKETTFIKAEYVDDGLSISCFGSTQELLSIAAMTYAHFVNISVKEGCPDSIKRSIAEGVLASAFDTMEDCDSTTFRITRPLS